MAHKHLTFNKSKSQIRFLPFPSPNLYQHHPQSPKPEVSVTFLSHFPCCRFSNIFQLHTPLHSRPLLKIYTSYNSTWLSLHSLYPKPISTFSLVLPSWNSALIPFYPKTLIIHHQWDKISSSQTDSRPFTTRKPQSPNPIPQWIYRLTVPQIINFPISVSPAASTWTVLLKLQFILQGPIQVSPPLRKTSQTSSHKLSCLSLLSSHSVNT